jgi:superfamily II DNA or RNA helicase
MIEPKLTLRERTFARAYDSGNTEVDVVNDFLSPALSSGVSYDRLAGYFNSGALAAAARGISEFVLNGGKMRVIASPQLSPKDLEILKTVNSQNERLSIFSNALLGSLTNSDLLADEFERDHVAAMAWMLREGQLEIRIALAAEGQDETTLFHQKVGVITDAIGDQISFSGSINETAAGWTKNIEEFKVFRSWHDAESDFVMHDKELFNRYWSADQNERVKVVPLEKAVFDEIIKLAPRNFSDLRLSRPRKSTLKQEKPTFALRDYQKAAIEAWLGAGRRGLLEMATGTGKTKTALACFEKVLDGNPRLMTVITAPYQHIAAQWVKEFSEHEPLFLANESDWRESLHKAINECMLGVRSSLVIISVQNTACSTDFLHYLELGKNAGLSPFLIADEVHGLGSKEFQKALSPIYELGLGLSATPSRWFDEEGSATIEDYFGGSVFKFTIQDALTWINPLDGLTPLCPYEYEPVFVELNSTELVQYEELTKKIIKLMSFSDDPEVQKRLANLQYERADIVKEAEAKLSALRKKLSKTENVSRSIIYCNNFHQMEAVQEILRDLGIRYRRFTGQEGTRPQPEYNGYSERDWALRDFGRDDIEVLIAIKCLDEGVDIPSATTGYILASSGNPREFIQRRGRLLRRYPGKEMANVIDFVVKPSVSLEHDLALKNYEKNIFQKELARMDDFSQTASNYLSVLTKIDQVKAEIGY